LLRGVLSILKLNALSIHLPQQRLVGLAATKIQLLIHVVVLLCSARPPVFLGKL
jgi:hypothetical protein